MSAWHEPAVYRDDFVGDFINSMLLRPVYRKPYPPEQKEVKPVEKEKVTYTFERDIDGNYSVYGPGGFYRQMTEEEFDSFFVEDKA